MVAAVVGVVVFGAAIATVAPPTKFGGAARENALHGPVVGGTEVGSVGAGVVVPVPVEDVCQGEAHGRAARR
jgi:hypothetical protein